MIGSTPAKPYRLTYEVRPGYLYVCVKCPTLNYEIARAYWDEIIELRKDTNSIRVLVEKDIPVDLSASDVFRIGSEVASSGFAAAKLAVYDPHTSAEIRDLGLIVSTNRGLNAINVSDFSIAESWLMAD